MVCYYRPQGKVLFSQVGVSHSVHNRPHGYSITARPCYGVAGTHPTGMLSCLAKFLLTRMHSSKMCATCLLTISHSIPCISGGSAQPLPPPQMQSLREADPSLDTDPTWEQTPPWMQTPSRRRTPWRQKLVVM